MVLKNPTMSVMSCCIVVSSTVAIQFHKKLFEIVRMQKYTILLITLREKRGLPFHSATKHIIT